MHTPLTEKTKGMIGKDFFNKAKSTLQVINVARGGIIDEAALFEAIDKNKLPKLPSMSLKKNLQLIHL